LSLWDHSTKNTLRIDLWSKDMPVEDMKRFYIDCLGGLAQSVLNATGDEYMSSEMNALCDKFVTHLKNELS
jgi:gliding motility-associated protein GldC